MNYLAHIALSGKNPEHQIGGFLGDFHRGPIHGHFPLGIETGIIAHRRLDTFVDNQQELHSFLQRFDKPMRRYAGIVADIVYDHILADQWHLYYDLSLDEFCQGFYINLKKYEALLPVAAKHFLYRAPSVGWLQSYRDPDNLSYILKRVGQRFKKPVALEAALPIFFEQKVAITQEFHTLYPKLQRFMTTNISQIDLH